MTTRAPKESSSKSKLQLLTKDWGSLESVNLYLDRCQVDTPDAVVSAVWRHVAERRKGIGKVIDFGAGDGRFAKHGKYKSYLGYEIDTTRCRSAVLPRGARLRNFCAFSDLVDDADVCIGNPPYVRNQDLPTGWRERAAGVIQQRTEVVISGLANAWQYFALLALASTKHDGLVTLVIPFEWVSRPSARALRDYILDNEWNVTVYRLRDETFNRVLTTASITVIDKRGPTGKWEYFEEASDGKYKALATPSGGRQGVIKYLARSNPNVNVRRGLSPGTQEVLTLTEGERNRYGLKIDHDVVSCVTSLRTLDTSCRNLTASSFQRYFRDKGLKCWLIRTDKIPSVRLQGYLDAIPAHKYETSTCLDRDPWWSFKMPGIPSVLIATGFCGPRPKGVINTVGAIAIGGVAGIYGLTKEKSTQIVYGLSTKSISSRIVSHSNGLRKIEIGQLATLVASLLKVNSGAIK